MKKRISVLLVLSLVLILMNVSPVSSAVSKPKLSKTFLTLRQKKEAVIKVRNVDVYRVKKITAKSSRPSLVGAWVENISDLVIVHESGSGDATVTVTVVLKYKIAGKKKYKLKLNVTVPDDGIDSPDSTFQPINTLTPTVSPSETYAPVGSKRKQLADYVYSNGKEWYDGRKAIFSIDDNSVIDTEKDLKGIISNNDGTIEFGFIEVHYTDNNKKEILYTKRSRLIMSSSDNSNAITVSFGFVPSSALLDETYFESKIQITDINEYMKEENFFWDTKYGEINKRSDEAFRYIRGFSYKIDDFLNMIPLGITASDLGFKLH